MKTVFEQDESGLPSFQTERPKTTEFQQNPGGRGADWTTGQLQYLARTSEWENVWRGIREYDSPLAG